VADVFGKDTSNIEVYPNQETALDEICREIENAIGNYAPDSQFKDSLLQRDIVDGPDDANWNGFRNKDSIRYFLYEYELYLREGNPEGEFQSLPSFEEWQTQDTCGIQIEHIWAQIPDEELTPEEESEHDTYYQALGNLALLSPGENETGSNMNYVDKYEEVYHESSMAMIRELQSPEGTDWRAEDIHIRGKKLAEFALERWGVETGAFANVSQLEPEENEDEVRREVIRQIREDFSGVEALNNLPKVEIGDSNLTGSWEEVSRCPECGGTQFQASLDDSSLNVTCACGESLSSPTYKVKIVDYS
jgi:ribosomal protein S27E